MIDRETEEVNQHRSPTIRRRRLGVELRRHREEAGVTIDVVADRLGCSTSKVSRIETGHTSASPTDVSNILSRKFWKYPAEYFQLICGFTR